MTELELVELIGLLEKLAQASMPDRAGLIVKVRDEALARLSLKIAKA